MFQRRGGSDPPVVILSPRKTFSPCPQRAPQSVRVTTERAEQRARGGLGGEGASVPSSGPPGGAG